MNALVALIPVTLLLVAIAVALFFWAVRHGQFRNLETPEILPLLDDPDPLPDDAPATGTDIGRPSSKETQA